MKEIHYVTHAQQSFTGYHPTGSHPYGIVRGEIVSESPSVITIQTVAGFTCKLNRSQVIEIIEVRNHD